MGNWLKIYNKGNMVYEHYYVWGCVIGDEEIFSQNNESKSTLSYMQSFKYKINP